MHFQAYKHLKSKKSKLASDVLEGIKDFFKGPDFVDQPAKVRDYVRWALHPGGPAYYAVPTPKECKGLRRAPGYKVGSCAMFIACLRMCSAGPRRFPGISVYRPSCKKVPQFRL